MAQLQTTDVDGTLTALRLENVKTSNYTLALEDRDKVVAFTGAGAQTVTVPTDSAVNFPIGSVVYIARIAAGNVEILAASGVTVSKLGFLGPNEEIALRKRAANNWQLIEEKQYTRTGTGGTLTNLEIARIHNYTATGGDTFTVE